LSVENLRGLKDFWVILSRGAARSRSQQRTFFFSSEKWTTISESRIMQLSLIGSRDRWYCTGIISGLEIRSAPVYVGIERGVTYSQVVDLSKLNWLANLKMTKIPVILKGKQNGLEIGGRRQPGFGPSYIYI